MKLLLLNGNGIHLSVNNSRLHIKDGRFSTTDEPEEYVFSPKRIDVDNVVIYGKNGELSIDAIRWLIKHNVQITILNWDGKLLTTMLPPESVQVKTKFAQYHSYSDNSLRVELAKKIIEAKFARTQTVLDWLKSRYPAVINDFSKDHEMLKKTRTISEIMMVEGRVASHYWQQIRKIMPKKLEFTTREYQKKPWGAGDQLNCMLNYGYAILEAECMRAINSSGLDVHVGFMHEMTIGKNSLAYDMQEPFRFLIDLAIIGLVEKDCMEKKDFIRTENFNLRLRPSGARKLVTQINEQFNKKIEYNGKQCLWSYVLLIKTRELAQYLLGMKKNIDFISPSIPLERVDNEEMREKILKISYSQWERLGFSKGTLFYMKKNAKQNKPFSINKHVQERLKTYPLVEIVEKMKNS